MASVQYRCLSCGSVHETSVRPGGAVYLRCVTTGEWAWHDVSRFLNSSASAPAESSGRAPSRSAGRKSAPRSRTAKVSRTRSGARAPRVAARSATGRKSGGRLSGGKRTAAKRRKR